METNNPILSCNVTGEERKRLVNHIGSFLGAGPGYLGAPSFAYVVGSYTIDRSGNITIDDSADPQQVDALIAYLAAQGFTAQRTQDADLEAAEEPVDTNVVINEHGLDAPGMINLLRMLYSRQHLIQKMARAKGLSLSEQVITRLSDGNPSTTEDVLRIFESCTELGLITGVTLTAGTFGLTFPLEGAEPACWQFGSVLMNAMVDKCKAVHRVNAKLLNPADEEMKYHARGWLLQLGLGGESHAAFRHGMLDHLNGYAAFKTTEDMNAHNAKYADLRKQKKLLALSEAAAGEEDGE